MPEDSCKYDKPESKKRNEPANRCSVLSHMSVILCPYRN